MLQESGFMGNHWELLPCIKILLYIIICQIRISNSAGFGLHVYDGIVHNKYILLDHTIKVAVSKPDFIIISSYQSEMYRTWGGEVKKTNTTLTIWY